MQERGSSSGSGAEAVGGAVNAVATLVYATASNFSGNSAGLGGALGLNWFSTGVPFSEWCEWCEHWCANGVGICREAGAELGHHE